MTNRTEAIERLLLVVAEMAASPISVSSPGAPHRAALLVRPGFVEALSDVKNSERSEAEVDVEALRGEKELLLLALRVQISRSIRFRFRLSTVLEALILGEYAEAKTLVNDAIDEWRLAPSEESVVAARTEDLVAALFATSPDVADESERLASSPDESVAADSPDAPYDPDAYLPEDRRGEEAEDDEIDDRPYESGLSLERTRDLTAEG